MKPILLFFFSSVADWNPGMNFGGFWPLWPLVALFSQPCKGHLGSASSVYIGQCSEQFIQTLSEDYAGRELGTFLYDYRSVTWIKSHPALGRVGIGGLWQRPALPISLQGARKKGFWSDCNRTAKGSPVSVFILFHGISVLPNKRK